MEENAMEKEMGLPIMAARWNCIIKMSDRMTAKDAADYLGLEESTIRDLILNGYIYGGGFDKATVTTKSHVESFKKRLSGGAGA